MGQISRELAKAVNQHTACNESLQATKSETLASAGISRMQASRYERVATLPPHARGRIESSR